MSKLLVNAPSGAQELIEIGDGGGYFDASRVLWDERADGPLPAITIGGMKRVGDALVIDQAMLDAWNALQKMVMVEKLEADAEDAVENLLDTTARAHGYKDLERCTNYRGSSNPFWNAEGLRAFAWRDECWLKSIEVREAAKDGNWPTAGAGQIPTVADVVAAMPPANWPKP